MESNKFFRWVSRINSILFLVLIILGIGLMSFGFFLSNRWESRQAVEINDESENNREDISNLRLGGISKVCGSDIQFVKLNSHASSRGFASGGYGSKTRNIVFFIGKKLESHWLFETNTYFIANIDQLEIGGSDCKYRNTVAIYYEILKEDTNKDGRLDEGDAFTVALTTAEGKKYTEIDTNITSIMDHEVDEEAEILSLLVQEKSDILMKKYSLRTFKKISEKLITRIRKKI